MNSVSPVRCILLPKLNGSEARKLVEQLRLRLKELRLESLQVNPEAFGSSYDVEVKFEDSVWENRLKNLKAQHFVALDFTNVSPMTDNSHEGLLQQAADLPWIGMTVLAGPNLFDGTFPTASVSPAVYVSQAKHSIISTQPEAVNGPHTLIYTINGVYVSPAWRKYKIATKLLQNARELAQELINGQGNNGDVGACLVFVDEDNPIARGLYGKVGFVEVMKENYVNNGGKERIALALQYKLAIVNA
jgi:ribosomal protein S18 acetylase RimI-like enzyme